MIIILIEWIAINKWKARLRSPASDGQSKIYTRITILTVINYESYIARTLPKCYHSNGVQRHELQGWSARGPGHESIDTFYDWVLL